MIGKVAEGDIRGSGEVSGSLRHGGGAELGVTIGPVEWVLGSQLDKVQNLNPRGGQMRAQVSVLVEAGGDDWAGTRGGARCWGGGKSGQGGSRR